MTIYSGDIAGDLFVEKGDDTSGVTSVGGGVYVAKGATCDLSACTSVDGGVYVREGATCKLPKGSA